MTSDLSEAEDIGTRQRPRKRYLQSDSDEIENIKHRGAGSKKQNLLSNSLPAPPEAFAINVNNEGMLNPFDMDSSNSSSINDGEVQEVIVQTRSSELIVLHDVSSQTDQVMYSSNAEFQAYSVRKFNELKVAINQVRDLVLASSISPQSSTDNMSNDFEELETIFPVSSDPDWESFNASLAEGTRKQQV
ncbi:unnamed protein product, partial [Allacma fusca]